MTMTTTIADYAVFLWERSVAALKQRKCHIIACKINEIIVSIRRQRFSSAEHISAKDLWAQVRSRANTRNKPILIDGNPVNANQLNQYFAGISTDPGYKLQDITQFYRQNLRDPLHTASLTEIHNFEIEPILRRVKNTAPGCDKLPAWLFQKCSVELADVIARLLNLSFATGQVYTNWKLAVVTPVPKVTKPASMGDFRPISVTPILSRIAEKIVVRRWLYPAIPSSTIQDQFAFRPSGSTTCALVNLFHHVSHMLETNSYVRCLTIDYSKAFDVVSHTVLLHKISNLDLSDNIHNWIVSFFWSSISRNVLSVVIVPQF